MSDKTPACPSPHKKRYATAEAAQKAAHGVQIAIPVPLHPYICVCTWWHLSKQPPTQLPPDAVPHPDDIARLHLLSDTGFRDLVATEARGQADLADRIALRDPSVLPRWHGALNELRADINTQLHDRRQDPSLLTHDWRKRAEGYRDSLTLRLQECRDLRARELEQAREKRAATRAEAAGEQQRIQQHAAASNAARRAARAEETDRQLDTYGVPRHIDKDLRRQAGEKAVKRLIDAHGAEFSRYLAEECAVLGATIPNRVRKYLTDGSDTDYARTA